MLLPQEHLLALSSGTSLEKHSKVPLPVLPLVQALATSSAKIKPLSKL